MELVDTMSDRRAEVLTEPLVWSGANLVVLARADTQSATGRGRTFPVQYEGHAGQADLSAAAGLWMSNGRRVMANTNEA